MIGELSRFAALNRDDPKMTHRIVFFEIGNLDRVNNQFAIWRDLRIGDALDRQEIIDRKLAVWFLASSVWREERARNHPETTRNRPGSGTAERNGFFHNGGQERLSIQFHFQVNCAVAPVRLD